ncbi:LPXTG cell wall anchor domain-containing protein [Lactococcus lactis]|uniref:LPXTG cell wall anchor domain-containing protein n=1 Tax=Lactococcus lactis TaxID=1358 RepID=UPI0021AE912E|nr:LPXTG cell wall anchor domain-containing protein [Lactococcus lactis]MCT0449790.1 LPXTG cell wall anchor domain-containing protein [Lactococcus lactis subsp. lactis]
MKKIVITLIALFSVLVFSQPIRADTTNSIVTKGTISFKESYTPQKPSNTIPNGKTVMISNNKNFVLPRTGETEVSHLNMLGFLTLVIGIAIKIETKNRKNF